MFFLEGGHFGDVGLGSSTTTVLRPSKFVLPSENIPADPERPPPDPNSGSEDGEDGGSRDVLTPTNFERQMGKLTMLAMIMKRNEVHYCSFSLVFNARAAISNVCKTILQAESTPKFCFCAFLLVFNARAAILNVCKTILQAECALFGIFFRAK